MTIDFEEFFQGFPLSWRKAKERFVEGFSSTHFGDTFSIDRELACFSPLELISFREVFNGLFNDGEVL